MSDEQTIAAVLAGDVEAFEGLVRRYERAVFAIARSHGLDGEADDVAQEVFLRAFRALTRFDAARGRFAPWFYAIARNGCRDALRRRVPTPTPAPEAAASGHPVRGDLGGDLGGDDGAARLDAALAALSPERRMAFLLTEVHGLPQAEVAEIEGVEVGTIKSRLSRAKAALRAALEPELESER